ncbi:protein ABIL3-like [Rutidosis leptorrhynchoides]|uniref:protein ABIL3-like n=1 Tax=Rutidosis leptorrhynchoides TaxID=125765 RepID=UPI003A9A6219
MESNNTPVSELHPLSNYEEVLLRHSLLFSNGLKDLRNVKEQLYSAAEHFEDSYKKSDQKQMLLESVKDYYIAKSLVKTIDHLGSVTNKIDKFLDEHVTAVSRTKLRLVCVEQSLRTCQEYGNHGRLTEQSLMMQTLKYHKQYPAQESCISKAIKRKKEMIQSSGLRKGYSGQPSTESPIAFSFTEAASHKRLEKRSRSNSPLRFSIKRSASAANESTYPSLSVKVSASYVHRSISPSPSSSRQKEPPEAWRSQSLYPQKQSTQYMEVYSKKTRNLFKVLLNRYKSKNNIK